MPLADDLLYARDELLRFSLPEDVLFIFQRGEQRIAEHDAVGARSRAFLLRFLHERQDLDATGLLAIVRGVRGVSLEVAFT